MRGEANTSSGQTDSGQEQTMWVQGSLRGELSSNSKRTLHRPCKDDSDENVSVVSTATMLSQSGSSWTSLCTSSNLSVNANLANLDALKKFGDHEEARLLRRKIGLRELRSQAKSLGNEASTLSSMLETKRRRRISGAASEVASCTASDLTSLTQREGASWVTSNSSGLMQLDVPEDDTEDTLWRRRLNLQHLREDPFALKQLPGQSNQEENHSDEESDDEAAWQEFRASVSMSTLKTPSELSGVRNCEAPQQSLPEQGVDSTFQQPTQSWTVRGLSFVAIATLALCFYSLPLLVSDSEGLL